MNSNILKMIFLIIFTTFLSTIMIAQDSTNAANNKKSEKNSEDHSKAFVDLDGDGYNDNAPDHDGDGIPNGLDSEDRKRKKN